MCLHVSPSRSRVDDLDHLSDHKYSPRKLPLMSIKRNRLDTGFELEPRVMLAGTVPGAEAPVANEAEAAPVADVATEEAAPVDAALETETAEVLADNSVPAEEPVAEEVVAEEVAAEEAVAEEVVEEEAVEEEAVDRRSSSRGGSNR